MDNWFFVFVTGLCSTGELRAVISAVKDLGHYSSSVFGRFYGEEDWDDVKTAVTRFDYYALIIGAGPFEEIGVVDAEREYDVAVESKRPIIALLHEDLEAFAADQIPLPEADRVKLKVFTAKVKSRHHGASWKSIADLKSAMTDGLKTAIREHPAVGVPHPSPTDTGLRHRFHELLVRGKPRLA